MFGEILKKCRLELSLTQEIVANKIGLTRQAYASYEADKNEPDLKTLSLLADIYHCSTDYLLGRTENKQNPEEITESINNETEQLTQEDINDLKEFIKQYRKEKN
jgi:transcriptional regulator with XRE-family HTH domain